MKQLLHVEFVGMIYLRRLWFQTLQVSVSRWNLGDDEYGNCNSKGVPEQRARQYGCWM